jgi:hypothetical protein
VEERGPHFVALHRPAGSAAATMAPTRTGSAARRLASAVVTGKDAGGRDALAKMKPQGLQVVLPRFEVTLSIGNTRSINMLGLGGAALLPGKLPGVG